MSSTTRPHVIAVENAKPGTVDWLPRRLSYRPGVSAGQKPGADRLIWQDSGRNAEIEGWCAATSVLPGDTLTIHVSTAPATDFTIDFYRMGYYQGLGARHMASVGPIAGAQQPDPSPKPGRLIECDWEPSYALDIPKDWTSGTYIGKLTRADNGVESYVIFVVRDQRQADLIAQTSEFTWQAYNRWPTAFSLYSNGEDDLTGYYGTDVFVSHDRPYMSTTYFVSPLPGTGEYFVFEYPFIYWLEQMGYDVTYCADIDTHRGTARFDRARAALVIGHDEYVTRSMYDNLTAARDSGLSLGFFAGNSYCFEVGMRPSSTGTPERVFSRVDAFGPDRSPESGYVPSEAELAYSASYPFPLKAPNDGLLMGARNHWPIEGVGDWVCDAPDHWVFNGTGMNAGESIPNLVGHEWHGGPTDIPGLEVISSGPTWEPLLGDGAYAATVYYGDANNIVFNAATCWWGTGLSHPPGFQRPTWQGLPSALPDRRVQQITQNVLNRMIGKSGRGSAGTAT
ncbi:N,N-dimethylformamidase beta subunit family domain-containing protein [Fodinicola acaciae]|uniref:N,N-dimethylformamidase beta subunit family domain-containing protein n=1 Tax=Fodinicola acaciae TaxID=2681555 RepID=UPI0013D87139|nr:N,N-dimethylformamidase beta subunit family domain-containing protein [Fodinicola acaciae]